MSIVLEETEELFVPNPGGQAEFMEDYVHRYCALAGGWYGGKTWAGARKLVNLHLYNAFTLETEEDEGGEPTYVNSAVVAPTYQLAMDINVPELANALDEAGLEYRWVADPKRFCFLLPDLGLKDKPSEIKVRTADAPEKLTGWTVGALWGDEAARWSYDPENPMTNPLIQADGRLRAPKANFLQFMVTFTHEGDATMVYEDYEENPKPDHVLYRVPTVENPTARQFAIQQAAQLTPELAEQYLGGKALSLLGSRIYSAFDEVRNKKRVILDPDIPLDMSIDFNIYPGMHAVLGQEYPLQDLFTAYRVIHERKMDIRRMMAVFAQWIKDRGSFPWPELRLFGDASGNNKWVGTSETAWDVVTGELKRLGIKYRKLIQARNPDIGDRVNAFNCALHDLGGQVHYHVNDEPGLCDVLIKDFKNVKWDGNELDKRDRKISHSSDGEGYRIHMRRPVQRIQTVGFRPVTVPRMS